MSIKQFGLFDSKETENYICHKEIYVLADGNVETKPTKDISQNGNTSEGSSEGNMLVELHEQKNFTDFQNICLIVLVLLDTRQSILMLFLWDLEAFT